MLHQTLAVTRTSISVHEAAAVAACEQELGRSRLEGSSQPHRRGRRFEASVSLSERPLLLRKNIPLICWLAPGPLL